MNNDRLMGLMSASYDVAAGAAPWSRVLELLRQNFNCHYAASISTTACRTQPRSLAVSGIDADDHRAFLRTWHKGSIYGARRPITAAGAVVQGRSIVRMNDLLKSDIYNIYFKPRRINETLRLDVLHDGADRQAISLSRPWSAVTRRGRRARHRIAGWIGRAGRPGSARGPNRR